MKEEEEHQQAAGAVAAAEPEARPDFEGAAGEEEGLRTYVDPDKSA